MLKCGVVGIGHLGKALTKQISDEGFQVYAHHPNLDRRIIFANEFTSNVKAVDFDKLLNQKVILLAIPAEAIQPFLKKAQEKISNIQIQPIFVNLSSLVDTRKLVKEFSKLKIYGVKMIGHADYLYEKGDGIFLTETPLNTEGFKPVRLIFESIGRLFEDDEDLVKKINGLAVKHIIQACVNFEKETNEYPTIYREKAMKTIFPNTMKLYNEKSFDGFMLKVIKEMTEK